MSKIDWTSKIGSALANQFRLKSIFTIFLSAMLTYTGTAISAQAYGQVAMAILVICIVYVMYRDYVLHIQKLEPPEDLKIAENTTTTAVKP